MGKSMEKCKEILKDIFIDGMSGMTLGLFSTLIIGTIIAQIGNLIGGSVGEYLIAFANMAKTVTGAGIGVGVACKYKQGPLVTVAAAVTGMLGAFPALSPVSFVLGRPGEPLGAFIAAIATVKMARLVAGKTKVDILVTPFVSIISGGTAAFLVGPYISRMMSWLGNLVNVNVEAHPVLGGIVVSVLMGIILTLPISSAALGVSMGITGIAAGAATVGCCCNMVGFAVASYRENKVGGLVAQGVGTSMLQMPNIMKKPVIWIPAIVSSAILGPISSAVLGMTSNPVGSGMGSAGLVGQFAAFDAMTAEGMGVWMVLGYIFLMHFLFPALISLLVSEGMRKKGWIKQGDMSLNL